MQFRKVMVCVLLAGLMAAAQTAQDTPRAGWTPAPRQGTQRTAGGMSEAQITKAVEGYRQMWRRMKPNQQQQSLRMGGYTPEQYERMLRSGSAAASAQVGAATAAPDKSTSPDYHRGADAGALDAMGQSLIDLNTIRDVNVGRVQKDGCPPEVASRIADLRGRLALLKSEPSEHNDPAQTATPAQGAAGANAIDVAANWYKANDRPPTSVAAGPSPEQLLDSVLPSGGADRPKPPLTGSAAARRKAQEDSVAQIEAELAQLLGACVPAKP